MGLRYVPNAHTKVLALDRGGLRVSAEDSEQYEELVAVLLRVAKGGFTYATPDCPEVYFLSGLRNPTRTMFDFFDDPEGRTGRILEALEQRQVTAIVLNLTPEFSPPPSPELAARLAARFPQRRDIGRFVVMWRE